MSQDIIDQWEINKQRFKNQLPLKKTCWQRIYEILEAHKATAYTFHEKTLLSSDYYSKAKNNNPSPPSVETIVAIAAGYSLDLQLTEELLKLAGRSFNPTSRKHDLYIFIIVTMSDYDIDAKNALLEEDKFDPLGTKSRVKIKDT